MFRTTAASRAFLVVVAATALAAGATASPRKRAAKAAPLDARPVAGSRFTGELISLDLKDADVKDVLRTFAKLARVNVAIDPEVKGSVTVRLHDVP